MQTGLLKHFCGFCDNNEILPRGSGVCGRKLYWLNPRGPRDVVMGCQPGVGEFVIKISSFVEYMPNMVSVWE